MVVKPESAWSANDRATVEGFRELQTLRHQRDPQMSSRLDELENLPDEEKKHVFHYMDLIIRNFKTKTAFAH